MNMWALQSRLANRLTELACDRDHAPYIARELVRMWFIQADEQGLSDWIPRFKEALGDRMEKAHGDPGKPGSADLSACPGVRGFTEEDWSDFLMAR
jgi:hypothetical protein